MSSGSRTLARSVTRNTRWLGVGTGLISLHQLCEAAVPILIGIGIDRAVTPGDPAALGVVGRRAGRPVHGVDELLPVRCPAAHARDRARGLPAARRARREDPGSARDRTDKRAGELLSISSTDADNVSNVLDYIPRIAGHELHVVDEQTQLDPLASLEYLTDHHIDLIALTPTYLR
jgi:putative ABC transport system ATP-binding protein